MFTLEGCGRIGTPELHNFLRNRAFPILLCFHGGLLVCVILFNEALSDVSKATRWGGANDSCLLFVGKSLTWYPLTQLAWHEWKEDVQTTAHSV